MPITLLPGLLLQILIIGYTPGPANIYSLAMSLQYGRKPSLVMWPGLLAGFSIAVCLMAVLAHWIGLAFAEYIPYLKYPGAAYILYLAYKVGKSRGQAKEKDSDCSFTSGMIVQMTNVKMLLFDLTAFGTFVLPYSSRLTDLLAVGTPHGMCVVGGVGSKLSCCSTRCRNGVDVAFVGESHGRSVGRDGAIAHPQRTFLGRYRCS